MELGIIKKETPVTEKTGKENDLSSCGSVFPFLVPLRAEKYHCCGVRGVSVKHMTAL